MFKEISSIIKSISKLENMIFDDPGTKSWCCIFNKVLIFLLDGVYIFSFLLKENFGEFFLGFCRS